MTEENIWKVLDAWREDKTSVVCEWTDGYQRRPPEIDHLLSYLRNGLVVKWFIDGKDVV